MKVGIVLASAPAYSETFFNSKIKGLRSSGNDVVLFCSKNPHDFRGCTIKILPHKNSNILKQTFMLIKVYFGLITYFNTISRFIKLERKDGISWSVILKRVYFYAPIFKENIDWLHFGFGSLAIGAENIARSKQAKMAVSFRGLDIGVYPLKFPNCYNKLWQKVTKIHVISNDIKELLYKNGFDNQAKVTKITPAINVEFFSSDEKFDYKTPIKIVSVARLHWKKGLDYTLEALSILKIKGVKFQYCIIGEGSEEEALKYDAYRFGLQNEVKFLGKLDQLAIKEELAKSHIYLQYSVQEGFCNAVLEAQSMGLLCIVSDAEGLSENIVDGKSGWVVPKRNPNLLVNKILEVIDLPDQGKELIRKYAVKRVADQFNLKKQEEEFIQFYEKD